jgi:hypothetical protein
MFLKAYEKMFWNVSGCVIKFKKEEEINFFLLMGFSLEIFSIFYTY